MHRDYVEKAKEKTGKPKGMPVFIHKVKIMQKR